MIGDMVENERALVSVIVTYYNNGDYIFETLESIFSQTYPNIEVIVSDDHSRDFDAERINEWIKEHRTASITNVIVRTNEENVGTVKNLEIARSLAKGKYMTQIAGDDTFYDSEVFTTFIDRLEELGESAEFLTGQCLLMDSTLNKCLGTFVTEETVAKFDNYTGEEMFNELTVNCLLPAVYFCRSSLIDKIGNLSDRYRLIEDWTGSLRMARLGVRFHYLDSVIMKHRDGGVSHGNKSRNTAVYKAYVDDYLTAYRYEVLPYAQLISDTNIAIICSQYTWWSSEHNRLTNKNQQKEEKAVEQKSFFKRACMGVIDSCINLFQKIRFSVQDKWFK